MKAMNLIIFPEAGWTVHYPGSISAINPMQEDNNSIQSSIYPFLMLCSSKLNPIWLTNPTHLNK